MTTLPFKRGNSARSVDPKSSERLQVSLGTYYSGTHLRSDAWDRLRHAAERLAREGKGGRRSEEHQRQIAEALDMLAPIEGYWAFPGKTVLAELARLFESGQYRALSRRAQRIVRLLTSDAYRRRDTSGRLPEIDAGGHEPSEELEGRHEQSERLTLGLPPQTRPYFEVLLVDDLTPAEEAEVRSGLLRLRRDSDEFVYDVVTVPSLEEALNAILLNYNIQTCVLRYTFPFRSERPLDVLQPHFDAQGQDDLEEMFDGNSSLALGYLAKRLRPELDLFLVTDSPVEEIAGQTQFDFRRIFYRQEDYLELHLSILKGIRERYQSPFFTALKTYSQKPTGVFHAMPLSRGKSISRSHWIHDMGRFYGANIFLAETSATTGGLDSLLQPQGPLKQAQRLAARAFGARRTYFVTNGTSAANKIVSHALVRPGDIVLLTRDCHKSHHYAMQLAGAHTVYMDPYPLSEYSIFGAVPLRQIKQYLVELRKADKLDRVRMLLLTNCTFDGITYNPERVMQEVLAIKPDMIFLWDEAWFAFAGFNPTLRRRTGMEAARRLRDLYRSDEYRDRYAVWKAEMEQAESERGDDAWLDRPLMADPDRVKVRVYVTQSTHKTLTALRQGSMIHIFDQSFENEVGESFESAYMTYTSTSPNYQILASLDIGRRQVELEGYELVQRSMELSLTLRRKIAAHPLLARYFKVLGPADLIPAEDRPSGIEDFYDEAERWQTMDAAWSDDEFVLDPSRVTLHIGLTGMDGDTFKKYLMDLHDTQINKTSRNTVLFMVHIGTTRGQMAHLIEVLTRIAEDLDERLEDQNPIDRRLHDERVRELTLEQPPLPTFSRFHPRFLSKPDSTTPEGDLRSASFLAYDRRNCEYLPIDGTVERELERGREIVSAGFVTPYPPGFPVLVPGQVLSREILDYLKALDVKEIHGYRPEHGLRVFTEEVLVGEAPALRHAATGTGAADSD